MSRLDTIKIILWVLYSPTAMKQSSLNFIILKVLFIEVTVNTSQESYLSFLLSLS